MDENLVLQEKAAHGDAISIEVMSTMHLEAERKIAAEAKAEAELALNRTNFQELINMQEEEQEDQDDQEVGDSKQAMNDMVVENAATPVSVDNNIANGEKLLTMEGRVALSPVLVLMLKVTLDSIEVPILFGTPSRPQFVCQSANFPVKTCIFLVRWMTVPIMD
jgi:hypothetical protein